MRRSTGPFIGFALITTVKEESEDAMETLTKTSPITVEQFLHFEAPPGYRAELLGGEISEFFTLS